MSRNILDTHIFLTKYAILKLTRLLVLNILTLYLKPANLLKSLFSRQ